MPGRTHGETRAMRDASWEYARRHGLPLDHAALVSMLEKLVKKFGVTSVQHVPLRVGLELKEFD